MIHSICSHSTCTFHITLPELGQQVRTGKEIVAVETKRHIGLYTQYHRSQEQPFLLGLHL